MNDASKFVFEVANGEARVTVPDNVTVHVLGPDGQHRTTRCSGDEQIPGESVKSSGRVTLPCGPASQTYTRPSV